MHLLRITLHVDPFGLVQGGAWDWYDGNGRRVTTVVQPMGRFHDTMPADAASWLAIEAWRDHEQQLSLF